MVENHSGGEGAASSVHPAHASLNLAATTNATLNIKDGRVLLILEILMNTESPSITSSHSPSGKRVYMCANLTVCLFSRLGEGLFYRHCIS